MTTLKTAVTMDGFYETVDGQFAEVVWGGNPYAPRIVAVWSRRPEAEEARLLGLADLDESCGYAEEAAKRRVEAARYAHAHNLSPLTLSPAPRS